MASVNKAIILGNLGADPTIRYLPSGEAVANLRIATTENWKDKNGDKQEATEWHSVSFFGKTADVCGQYLKKGSQVYIEGSLRTRKWQDKEGQDRYTTEIRGDRMQMLGGKQSEEALKAAPSNSGGGTVQEKEFDDDIPFISCSVCYDMASSVEKRMRRYE